MSVKTEVCPADSQRVCCLITDLIITHSQIIPPLHSHRWHNVPVQIFTLHVSPCFDICKHWVISWLTPGGDPQSLEFEIHHTCIYHWRSIEKTPDPYAKNIVRCYLLEGVVIFVLVMLWWGASEFACVIGCDYTAGLLYNLINYLY